MENLTRRSFLKVAGLALTAGCTARSQPGAETRDGPVATIPSASLSQPLPAPTEILITPTGQLYTQSCSTIPRVDLAAWTLTIDGLVASPLTLTYDDVQRFPKVESTRTLECIGNPVGGPLIGNPVWGGFQA